MTKERFLELIERFPRTRLLVVGDIMVDRYLWGKVSRISPEAPVPVVDVASESLRLGGAANVVHNIVTLGGKASLCGVIGRDEMGRRVLEDLQEKGVSTEGVVVVEERPTTLKTRIIAHSQQVVRIDQEVREETGDGTIALLLEQIRKQLPALGGIIISDYCKGVVGASLLRSLIAMSQERGILVAVDPKVRHYSLYQGSTVITPNLEEAAQGSGIHIDGEESLLRAGVAILKQLGCQAVLITRGEQGMSLFRREGSVTHIPTVAKEVYDVTGAGDTVIGAFTLALAAGATFEEAAHLSNYAAGIVVGEVGTVPVTREQMRERILEAFHPHTD
ncbi:MAG: D-glycero-beta-D-manno-heptose-7-phosphate kinase [Nitrospirae bacterium]|nr:D-glycero-beta-D-manno-heptose-7-phosphate kinase [Nitrospirota bacterium]